MKIINHTSCLTPIIVSIACLISFSNYAHAAEKDAEQSLFTLDENVWATFYDLPSRRFRSIRDALIRRQFDAVEKDLGVSIGFMTIEANRTVDSLSQPMSENIAQLEHIRANIRDKSISVSDLDAAFARAHWLLAQHYLVLARQSRDKKNHRNAGNYLWATAHHLERAVLWSDARIDRNILDSLESTRKMGTELQDSKRPEKVYRNKPIAKTAKTLVMIGDHLNRKVWVRDNLDIKD